MKIAKSFFEKRDTLRELNWANAFNSTIFSSRWLIDKSFSPVGFSIGYQLFYVLYRILDDVSPKNILEFGLGQSTKLFHQYLDHMKESRLTTLENDTQWIGFFLKRKALPENAQLIIVEEEKIRHGWFKTRTIKNVELHVENHKYDLILVDAPGGSRWHSRPQILKMVPGNIDPGHFIIIIDDTHRKGEKATCRELEKLFRFHGIKYCKWIYRGLKSSNLYCSPDLRFLTTL